jgi:nucleotide-binding universal stress UspA family protein
VLEGDKVADALIEYAALNGVDQILVGAPLSGAAPCTVTVVRPPAAS